MRQGSLAATLLGAWLVVGLEARPPVPGANVAEPAPDPPATGMIIGQVVDGTTGQPVPEAIIDLLPTLAPGSATSI